MLFNFQKGKREREVFPGDPGVKNLPIMKELQETWVLSLGQEDPLKKGIAIHSSILAWRISWTEESGGLQSKGLPNSTWLKWISEHECKKKGNHIDHIIIKLMKFIKEKKSLKKLMKNNTVHFTYRNTKIRVISHLDKNYINHKIMKWHLMIACGLVLLNGSGEIVDLFL